MTGALPQGAPLAAQYLHELTPMLPADVVDLPVTSSRFRAALKAAAEQRGWTLFPSRRELSMAAEYVAKGEATRERMRTHRAHQGRATGDA